MSDIAYTQNNTDQGELKIQVTARGSNRPITNARVAISYSGDPDSVVEEVNTDASGMSEQITLPAPPLEFSMEPGEEQPFSQYSIQVDAEGFRPFTVSGIELFSKQLSLQEVRMDEVDAPGNPVDTIVIPVNTLWGDFPPKIAESEIKPISETGEIVLSRVVVPEYVVVHDGPPNDTTARTSEGISMADKNSDLLRFPANAIFTAFSFLCACDISRILAICVSFIR